MSEVVHGLYVAGLGDCKPRGQNLVGPLWRALYGINLTYSPVKWSNKEGYDNKHAFLFDQVSAIREANHIDGERPKIALVGSSAGFSACINTFASNPGAIGAVVGFCGLAGNKKSVADRFDENPAFEESLDRLPSSIAVLRDLGLLDRVLTQYPLSDQSVAPEDTLIEGARSSLLHMHGHKRSIAWGLTFESHKAAKFIHQQMS